MTCVCEIFRQTFVAVSCVDRNDEAAYVGIRLSGGLSVSAIAHGRHWFTLVCMNSGVVAFNSVF